MVPSGLMTTNDILRIQAELEKNGAAFRKLMWSALKDGTGWTVYTPPPHPSEILALMTDLV